MSEQDGGPAFPKEGPLGSGGMSLRDYFAAKAMQEIMARCRAEGGLHMGEIAELAYKQADWMLTEREK